MFCYMDPGGELVTLVTLVTWALGPCADDPLNTLRHFVPRASTMLWRTASGSRVDRAQHGSRSHRVETRLFFVEHVRARYVCS